MKEAAPNGPGDYRKGRRFGVNVDEGTMTLLELGQAIREKREAAGLSIDDVAGRIKISARILRTIEEGSQNGLPHAVYTKSFIRVYGQLVGWDADDLAVHLEELFPQESLDENSSEAVLQPLPLQYPGRGKRIAALVFLLLFLGAVGVGSWYLVTTYGGTVVEMVKKPFSALSDQDMEGEEHIPAASSALQQQDPLQALGIHSSPPQGTYAPVPLSEPAADALPPGSESSTGLPVSDAATASPASAGVGASEPAQSSIPVHEEPVGAASGNMSHQLRITAVQGDCWVGHIADGGKGRDYLLRTGERVVLAYRSSLEVTLGRAGNVRLELDGKELPSRDRQGRMVLRFP